jgi:uncharacterized membrane protein YccC
VTTRDAIVAALGTVPPLAPSPAQPAVIAAWMAWPVWRGTTWRNQVHDGARDLSWYVFVALPATGRDTTISETDPMIERIGQALADAELGVQLVEPYQLTPQAPGGDGVPVLRFTLGDR